MSADIDEELIRDPSGLEFWRTRIEKYGDLVIRVGARRDELIVSSLKLGVASRKFLKMFEQKVASPYYPSDVPGIRLLLELPHDIPEVVKVMMVACHDFRHEIAESHYEVWEVADMLEFAVRYGMRHIVFMNIKHWCLSSVDCRHYIMVSRCFRAMIAVGWELGDRDMFTFAAKEFVFRSGPPQTGHKFPDEDDSDGARTVSDYDPKDDVPAGIYEDLGNWKSIPYDLQENIMATRSRIIHTVFKELRNLVRLLRYNIRRVSDARWDHAWPQIGTEEHEDHNTQRCNATSLGLFLAALPEKEQRTLFSRESRWAMYPGTLNMLRDVIGDVLHLVTREDYKKSTPCNPVAETCEEILRMMREG
ncbi:hypothetical protein OQA88_530 [Cercophora sp. LCS_1]